MFHTLQGSCGYLECSGGEEPDYFGGYDWGSCRGIYVETGVVVQLEVLHLGNGCRGIKFWGGAVKRVAAPDGHARGVQNNGKSRWVKVG